jgi:hypothetical protein
MEPIPKINLPTPYKIQTKLTTLNKIGKEKILNFIGSNEVETMFYLYLFKKYKSNCFLYDKDVLKQTLGRRILGMSILIMTKYEPYEKKEIEDQLITLADVLVNCIKKDAKIIIIPVQLVFTDGCHANVLIYRKNLNQIEHFEPHGKNYSTHDDNTNKIILGWMKFFVSRINAELFTSKMQQIKLIESTDVCPYINGLQNLEGWSNIPLVKGVEPGGYCVAWSMFFTELCLKNPNIPSLELMNYIFNTLLYMSEMEKRDYLRSVIRGYSVFINEKITKYFSLFGESGLTIKKIQNFTRNKRTNFLLILKRLIELEMDLETDPLHIEKTFELITKKIAEFSKDENMLDEGNKTLIMRKIARLVEMKGFYEKYKKFKVSEPTESISSQIQKSIPKQNIMVQKKPVKVCPEGKEINPKTARCVKIKIKTKTQKVRKIKIPKAKTPQQKVEIEEPEIKSTKSCPPGKEINPKTGRCIKIKTKTQKVRKIKIPKAKTPKQKVEIEEPKKVLETVKLEPEIKSTKSCPPGKEINPKTGRCIKIKTQKVKKVKIPKMKTPKILPKAVLIPKVVLKLEPPPIKSLRPMSPDLPPPFEPEPKVVLEPVKLVPEIKVTKECPPGKEINPKTGRCVKVKTKTQKMKKMKIPKKIMEKLEQRPKTCPEGKEINPKTGRCIKVKTRKQKIRKIKM